MKKTLSIILIISFFLLVCLITLPQSAKAAERPLKSIFIDTMFGLATGTVIATAVTVADGDAHGDDWGRNLGIGATIGAFIGAAIGIATETYALVYFNGQGLDFSLPLPRPQLFSNSEHSSMVAFDLLDWRF